MPAWQLLSNHGRVLVFVTREPRRLRDIAAGVEVTERTAHRIVSDLVDQGYLIRHPNGGTRNSYEVRTDVPFHDPLLGEHRIGEVLAVLATTEPTWSLQSTARHTPTQEVEPPHK